MIFSTDSFPRALALGALIISSLVSAASILHQQQERDNVTATFNACVSLTNALGAKVSYPGQTAYATSENTYYSLQEQEITPLCIVSPTQTSDVSAAVAILTALQAPFAIRGGGHTLNAGAANIQNAITINMRTMKTVTVNSAKTVVYVQGGAKWGDVYPVLDAESISTSGGRVSDVGVGGLSTGGGISFFSGRYGLVCDNIINFEVVLAGGKIVSANQNVNSDLWVALRGGSNNFGVVTRFDIRTFSQGDFYGGVVIYPYSTVKAQLQAYYNFLVNFDPYSALIMSIGYSKANGGSVFNNIEYTKPVIDPPATQELVAIEPQYLNTMRIDNLTSFTVEASEYSASGLRNQFATTCFGGDFTVLEGVFNLYNASIAAALEIPGVNWAFTIQPFPKQFTAQTASLGGNSLGLSTAEEPLTLALLSYSWSSSSDDSAITALAQQLFAQIDSYTNSNGALSPFKYLNYAAYWQNPIDGYGAASVSNLMKVSAKYDPLHVFQQQVPGGFKVSNA